MNNAPLHPRDELLKLAAEYRHLKNERHREGEEGRFRRRQEAKLEELEERFESLLARWVEDEEDCASWREHLHRGDPAPDEPDPPNPLLYKARAETGSVLEVRQRRDGSGVDLLVDGHMVEHRPGPPPAPNEAGRAVGGGELTETFDASAEAIESLRRFVQLDGKNPPWSRARELLDDGLIDPNFGLTDRGRRALVAQRR